MAVELGRAYITIVPKASSNFSSVAKMSASQFSGSFTSGISSLGIAAGNLIASGLKSTLGGLNSIINEAITQADVFTRMPIMLETLGFSAEESSAALERLNQELKNYPTLVSEGASAVARMTASNGDLEKSVDIFVALNDAVMAGGAATQVQEAAIEQFQQAIAKGKPDRIEFRSFMQAFPGVMKQIAASMGMTTSELQEAFSGGKVSMDQFADALVALENNAVPGFKTLKEQALAATTGIQFGFKQARKAVVQGITDIILAMDVKRTAGFFTSLGQGIEKILQAFIPVGQALGNILGNAIDGMMAGLPNAISVAQSVADKIANTLNKIDAKGLSNLSKLLTPTIKAFTLLAGAIGNAVLALTEFFAKNEWAATAVGRLIAVMAGFSMAKSVFGVFKSGGKTIAAFGKKIGKVTSKIAEFTSTMIFCDMTGCGPLTSAVAGLSNAFPKLYKQIGTTAVNLSTFAFRAKITMDNVSELIATTGKGVSNTAPKAFSGITNGLVMAFSTVASVGSKAGSSIASAFAAVPVPVKVVLAVVAALAAAFIALFKTNEGFRNSVIASWEKIKAAFAPIADALAQGFSRILERATAVFEQFAPMVSDAISGIVDFIEPFLQPLGEMLSSSFSTLFSAFQEMGATLGPVLLDAFIKIGETFKSLLPTFQEVGMIIMDTLVVAFTSLVEIGTTMATTLAPVIAQIITTIAELLAALLPVLAQLVQAILPVLATLLGAIATVVGGVIAAILPVVTVIISTLANVLADILPIITNIITMIINMLVPIIQMIAPIIETIVTLIGQLLAVIAPILEFLTPIIQVVIEFVGGVLTFLISIIQGIIQLLTGDFEGAMNTFGQAFSRIGEVIWGVMSRIGEAVAQGIQNVINWFAELPGRIISAIGNLGHVLFEKGKELIQGFINGLKSAWDAVSGWVSDLFSGRLFQVVGPDTSNSTGVFYTQPFASNDQQANASPYNAGFSLSSRMPVLQPIGIGVGDNNGLGQTINVYLDDWSVNDDDRIKQKAKELYSEIERKRSM